MAAEAPARGGARERGSLLARAPAGLQQRPPAAATRGKPRRRNGRSARPLGAARAVRPAPGRGVNFWANEPHNVPQLSRGRPSPPEDVVGYELVLEQPRLVQQQGSRHRTCQPHLCHHLRQPCRAGAGGCQGRCMGAVAGGNATCRAARPHSRRRRT